jgi:tRNA nucleotidyltransferase (CCA-adding enzyme)
MDLITTHVNADFDCLGAMVAARKLYPGALMAFSGSQEKSMRDFFLKSTGYALDFKRLKDIDFSQISRLIIVDCQHSSRIGRFAEISARPGVEVHIYDHHPEAHGDIRPSGGEIRESGSSTSILAGILMNKGIQVDAVEATLMMLGIYEDTGNLTFPSTTVEDYRAAAWLLQQGANLNIVSDFITQELTSEQVSLLNDLLKSLRTISINGIDITFAEASVDYYIGDIAILSHMIRDMENLDVLFVAVDMGKRVYVVARSRLSEVDVGAVMRELQGGGHAHAASATVKDLTLIQVLARLEEALRYRVNPRRTAADIMSSPVKYVEAGATIEEARGLLTRYNVNAMPVMEGNEMLGIISRRIVERALYHHLGQVPVTEYMHTEFMRADLTTPLADIQEYIVGRERRLLPVFDNDRLAGVVTRTDLMRVMYSGFRGGSDGVYDIARDDIPVRRRHMDAAMQKHLTRSIYAYLKELGETGDNLDLPVYVVGGFVRDLLLGTENLDIDVTVEGDGILFAETFARRRGCRVKSHQKFGTAVLVFPDNFKIDVASTRLEYYSSPGALPTVERSSLKMDLYRRDFTINTLAIRLNSKDFGVLIDFFSAQRDLQDKVIRVLHNLSFVEDPTRVFRALRFEQRLGFRIAKHTENLIRNAVKMNFLSKLGGKRLLTELVIILKEKEPALGIERMASLGLLQFIHPELKLTQETRTRIEEAGKIIAWFDLLYLERRYEKWVLFFLVLTDSLDSDQFVETCSRLSLSEHYRERLAELKGRVTSILESMQRRIARGSGVLRSEVYFWLEGLPVEVLLYLMTKARSDEVKKQVSLFFTQLQGIRLSITGEDLKALGLEPGPRFKVLLDKVFRARLDNEALTREDELRIARREAKRFAAEQAVRRHPA